MVAIPRSSAAAGGVVATSQNKEGRGGQMPIRRLLVILGVPIDDLTMVEALDRLERFIQIGRSSGKCHQVATINADFVVKALADPELRYLLQEADMATADGMPLVWGARRLGVPLRERVAGADLVPALAARAAEKGFSLYFFGAAPGVAEKAAQVLKEQYPNLKIAGVASPPYGSVLEMDRAYLDEIKAAQPDVLLVAFGNPKQEKWIGMYGREVGVPVMIGVGGTLDLIAGKLKRAPAWMQRAGLEWLYRLVQEPGRLWRRYVVDLGGFTTFFLRQWWLMRQGNAPATVLPTTYTAIINQTAILNIQGRMDRGNCRLFAEKAQQALVETPYLVVNLIDCKFLDSTAIGTLVAMAKQARDAGGELWLAAVPEAIQRTLELLRLDRFFAIYENLNDSLEARHTRVLASPAVSVPTATPWTVIQMPRRLDATTATDMLATCAAALKSNSRLVLDFSQTAFLASAGLAALAQLSRQAKAQGGEVRLTGCSSDVRRVIDMVRFDQVVAVYHDLAAALA
jgi:N-acetylglucosaminyldiphosphoundecaprenol N-acetyl-beta-D-mannosaminyltransferase